MMGKDFDHFSRHLVTVVSPQFETLSLLIITTLKKPLDNGIKPVLTAEGVLLVFFFFYMEKLCPTE